MKSHVTTVMSLCMLLLVALGADVSARAQGITQLQANSILSELRQIRQLLEQMARASPAPAAHVPAPSAVVKLSVGPRGTDDANCCECGGKKDLKARDTS